MRPTALLLIALFLGLFLTLPSLARIINVPDDEETIQSGIEAADVEFEKAYDLWSDENTYKRHVGDLRLSHFSNAVYCVNIVIILHNPL